VVTSLIRLPGSAATPGLTVAPSDPVALPRVLLRGAEGALGRKVRELLTLRSDVEVLPSLVSGVNVARGSIDVLVELGAGDHDRRARRRESVTIPATELITQAEQSDVGHIVLVSTAMVYGASPSNPIPLTEEAVLRPDPDFVFARQMASAEQLVEQWRLSALGRSATVLRPVVIMSADDSSGLARALAAGSASRFGEQDPGSQFVHLDDVASAVVHVILQRLDGVFNVAPDGWIPSDRVRALTGERMSIPLPSQVAELLGGARWRFQRGPIPPGLRSYIIHPWLVANDRLRSTGWAPRVTNEQAYVEGTEAQWWTMVSPRRRQEMALAGLGAGVMGLLGLAIWVMVRWRRRARLQ
jgi:nucleoside-diphosphate-sugar epimerase